MQERVMMVVTIIKMTLILQIARLLIVLLAVAEVVVE